MSTALLGWLGAVFLLFGLLSFVLQIFSGFAFQVLDMPWIVANVVIGAVLLVVAFLSNLETLRERLRSGGARRAGKYGTSAVLNAALLVALFTMLAFLSTRYHKRFDWTESRSHSLTDQTHKILDGLQQDVEVTAFYQPVAAAPARELLERYQYASPRFKVTFVDPQARPGLVKELGVDESKLGNGLLMVKLAGEKVEVDDLSESALTNALVKLTRHEKKKVYFLTGHNERPIEGEGAGKEDGFQFAKEALQNENYSVEPLLLATKGSVPEDADVVVIAGPTRPFLPTELDALQRYVAGGGALLVLIDPRAATNLYDALGGWGVEVGDDVVVDRVQGLFGRPVSPFAAEYGPHPITEGMQEPVLFHMARSVQPKPEAAKAFTILVRTSGESWAERNLDVFFKEGRAELGPEDLKGPVPVAVAGQLDAGAPKPADKGTGDAGKAETKKARLVVVGDSDFAGNGLLRQFRNSDFFVNSVNWLLGDVEAISIRPNEARASRLQLTPEIFAQLRYLSLFVLPEAIAVAGVLVWWNRRRRQVQ
jgi:gliding motility-associatede transport system auxiliary component